MPAMIPVIITFTDSDKPHLFYAYDVHQIARLETMKNVISCVVEETGSLPSPGDFPDVINALKARLTISAIKHYRDQVAGCSLLDARNTVRDYATANGFYWPR